MAYDPTQVATQYAATFPARNDVYSHWTDDGWRPVREPLTAEVVLAGLTGDGPSISGFMIAPGSVSHVLAIDFDTDNGLEQALALASYMFDQGLPAYVETSRRGAHLWSILDHVVPAIALRAAARGLLQEASLPSDDPHIEIRPGTDRVDAMWDDEGGLVGAGLGHALRLPLMPHPKTGRRGQMLTATGNPIPGSLADMMLSMTDASSGTLLGWAELWRRPPMDVPADLRNPREPWPEDDASASDLLRTLWGALDAAPGKVFSCPAVAYHSHADRHKGCRVFPDDRRVFCHKPGCILNNDGRGRGTYELRKLAPSAGG